VVEVVRETHSNAALRGGDERAADDVGGVVAKPQVVEREIEPRARARDELGDGARDLQRGLPAVRQQPQVDAAAQRRYGADSALRFALWARFASW